MYATDFEYDQKRLSEFRMIVCHFDSASGSESMSSGADITYHQERASGSDIFSLHASTYDSPYTSTFQICKNPCTLGNTEDMYLSPAEISVIQRWLCRKSFHPFKIAQDGYRDIYWNAVFTAKQINLNGKIAGLELTMYTDSPYAYRDEVAHQFHIQYGTVYNPELNIKYFHNISDVEGYLYPDIEITLHQTGNLVLSLNGRETNIRNCSNREIITIKGKEHIISTSDMTHNIAKDFDYIFPRMERSFGENKNCITANISCTISLKYSPIVLIGL